MMDKKTVKRRIWDYLVITVSSFLYAVAVSLFLDPNSLAPGGVTGISIILNRLSGVETGTWILLLNVPIMLLGAWRFGIRFMLSSVYSTVLISFFTNMIAPMGAVTKEPILAAIAGGGLTALSLGWVFRAGATTGGMDIIIKVLRVKYPQMKTGFLYLMTDMTVVIVSAFVFQDIDKALYAAITVFLMSYLLDLVLYGRDGAKLIYIISDFSEKITERILKELDIGVTHMQGMGAYSKKEKNVIMCVIRKPLSHKVEEIVKEEDPMAFMIVTSATEIYGEGYQNIFSEKL